MKKEDYGKEFYIKNLTGRWIFYGMEENSGNDYGLSKRDYPFRYYFHQSGNTHISKKVDELQNVIKITNTMKITNIVKKILDVDTRTLVKAGFINGDLALTDEGVSELLGLLFLEKKAELVKIAQEKLDEESK